MNNEATLLRAKGVKRTHHNSSTIYQATLSQLCFSARFSRAHLANLNGLCFPKIIQCHPMSIYIIYFDSMSMLFIHLIAFSTVSSGLGWWPLFRAEASLGIPHSIHSHILYYLIKYDFATTIDPNQHLPCPMNHEKHPIPTFWCAQIPIHSPWLHFFDWNSPARSMHPLHAQRLALHRCLYKTVHQGSCWPSFLFPTLPGHWWLVWLDKMCLCVRQSHITI